MFDYARQLAIDTLIKRAREGDNRVLQVAAELAAEGNEFAVWLLESQEEEDEN